MGVQPPIRLTRRDILASASAAAVVGLAGCNNTESNDPDTESAAPTQTRTPTETLTVAANSTTTVSSKFYERVVWEETGRLVIEDGAGLGITEEE